MTDQPLRRQRNFLKLWTGQTISMLGSSVTGLALPLIAIYELDAGPAQIGVLNAAIWLPYVLLGLWAGAWGDRHRRRPVLIWTDLGRAVLTVGVVVAATTDVLTLPLLYVAVFVIGTLTMLFDVSYNSYVPAIVRRDLLVQANSRLQTSSSVAQVAGPGLGGGLVQLLTAPVALIADAISFLVSAVCLIWIRDREPAPAPRAAGSSMLREIRAGLVIVVRQPLLRGLVGIAAIFNFFSQWVSTLLVIFAVRELGMQAGNIGLIGTGAALGAVAGSLVTSRLSRRIGVGATMLAAVSIESAVMLGVAAVPAGHPGRATALLAAIYAASGVGAASSSILATSIRQTLTPPEFIGRMTATYKMISYGVVSVGALCGGGIGQLLGLRPGILLGAAGLLLTIVWTLRSAVFRLHDLPTEPLRMDATGRVVVPVGAAAAAATPAAQVQAGVRASTGARPGGVPDADPAGPPD